MPGRRPCSFCTILRVFPYNILLSSSTSGTITRFEAHALKIYGRSPLTFVSTTTACTHSGVKRRTGKRVCVRKCLKVLCRVCIH